MTFAATDREGDDATLSLVAHHLLNALASVVGSAELLATSSDRLGEGDIERLLVQMEGNSAALSGALRDIGSGNLTASLVQAANRTSVGEERRLARGYRRSEARRRWTENDLDLAELVSPARPVQDAAEASLLLVLDDILRNGSVRSVYQPIVDLDSGDVVAYEALARGPEDSPLGRPDLLFGAARIAGRVAELDWACQRAALQGALDAGMPSSTTLFVNLEPETLAFAPPPDLVDLVAEAGRRLRVVGEVTERAIAAAPAQLLATLSVVRDLGWGVAVDDLGAEAASLALLPLIRPDVVKLDLRLLHDVPDASTARLVGAVAAHAERTGSMVLAEGIETPEHHAGAIACGATLGQGWLFARPGPLPSVFPSPASRPVRIHDRVVSPATPVEAVGVRPFRRSTKRLLIEMSKVIEQQAAEQGDPTVVLGAFQRSERFTPATSRRYQALARHAPIVGAIGIGLDAQPAEGVRGGALRPDDPLVQEWTVAALSPHFAAALVAKDLGDDQDGEVDDDERRFEFLVTYDRGLVVDVATALMSRIAPLP